ncbi:unnamed protein product [Timema podura]|uniref:ATP synthase F0 subunit 8 n=1 Tax=Timema podura TaxID=61482 RepID=A0ABN7PKM6_TIMPD|nr:unnamed protein product [Timema podura]
MGLLVGEEVDSSAVSLTITRERSQNVIFSATIHSFKNSMYIRQPSVSDLSWRYFTMPFSSQLWLAMVASMCVTVLALVFLYLMAERFLPHQGAEVQTCSTCLLKIIGIFCQQG